MKPLNGTKTQALSAIALGTLKTLVLKPRPKSEINAGIVDRLLRGELVELASLPSPYKSHKGKDCQHLKITPKGLALCRKL